MMLSKGIYSSLSPRPTYLRFQRISQQLMTFLVHSTILDYQYFELLLETNRLADQKMIGGPTGGGYRSEFLIVWIAQFWP